MSFSPLKSVTSLQVVLRAWSTSITDYFSNSKEFEHRRIYNFDFFEILSPRQSGKFLSAFSVHFFILIFQITKIFCLYLYLFFLCTTSFNCPCISFPNRKVTVYCVDNSRFPTHSLFSFVNSDNFYSQHAKGIILCFTVTKLCIIAWRRPIKSKIRKSNTMNVIMIKMFHNKTY